ncbi:hypothetical protein ABH991_002570 [Bradyrhizobium ottawaense]|uniref:Uncharacterized protein n=1 Tax=Bradyrhizobium ottawaense TaxID=931866 RepID=A0ABV4FMA9_9BRAD
MPLCSAHPLTAGDQRGNLREHGFSISLTLELGFFILFLKDQICRLLERISPLIESLFYFSTNLCEILFKYFGCGMLCSLRYVMGKLIKQIYYSFFHAAADMLVPLNELLARILYWFSHDAQDPRFDRLAQLPDCLLADLPHLFGARFDTTSLLSENCLV